MAARIDPQHAEIRARSASLGTSVLVFRLWMRVRATTDVPLRRRAGFVMGAIASHLGCSGVLLERMLSVALAAEAAEATGMMTRDETRRAREPLGDWRSSATDAHKRLGTWPFFARPGDQDVQSEVERDERLMGPIPPPGIPAFSCRAKPGG
jgi:hypothetical protein